MFVKLEIRIKSLNHERAVKNLQNLSAITKKSVTLYYETPILYYILYYITMFVLLGWIHTFAQSVYMHEA